MSLFNHQILRYLAIVSILLLLRGSFINAQSLKYSSNLFQDKDWSFVENKGQLADENNNLQPEIKYYGHQGSVYLYCKPRGISFVFTKIEKEPDQISEATRRPVGKGAGGIDPMKHQTPQPFKITYCRVDLVLINSNPHAQILSSDQQEYYENFYLANTSEVGITNVHTFKTIIYKDIYHRIDLILHSREGGMKYEFMVHPGGRVADIQIQWIGLENLKIAKNGGIKYTLSSGEFEESKPICYQGNKELRGDFENREGKVCFEVGHYDKAKDLLIDPIVDWATYYGGYNYDMGSSLVTDGAGNIYMTGDAGSSTGIASSGSYQSTRTGNENAFLAKFSRSGSRLWATYYGGGNEYSYGVNVDGSGNVYITGITFSKTGIATSGAYQTSYAGGASSYNSGDAFLAKFSSSGSRQWSTYFGGSNYDEGTGVCTDLNGNVYISGITGSTDQIATNGAYETAFGYGVSTGGSDGFIAKFNSNGAIKWATYFGGPGDNQINRIATDASGAVYITGLTNSTAGIATNSAFLTAIQGGYDMFLAKFDSTGGIGWATYYGGSGYDYSEGLVVDKSSNIYIGGYTQSFSGIATKGAFLTKHNNTKNSYDGCLVKFDSSGSLKWGTYYGNAGNEEVYNLALDDSGNVYITGSSGACTGISTPDAYQTTCHGGQNAFIAKFNGNGKRGYGTFFGSGTESGSAISLDHFGNVYLTGSTQSSIGISTIGAYQTKLAGGENAFLAKFKFYLNNDAGIVSIQKPKTVCPGNYPISIMLKNYGKVDLSKVEIHWGVNFIYQSTYNWTGDLKPDSTAIINLGSVNFKPGRDAIQAWTEFPNGIQDSLIYNDSSTVIDTIYQVPVALVRSNHNACQGVPFSLGNLPVNGNQYLWSSIPSGFSSTLSNPVLTLNQLTTSTYILKETNPTGCSTIDSTKIIVNAPPVAYAGTNATICAGKSEALGKSPVAGNFYSWRSDPAGFMSLSADTIVEPAYSTKYILTVINLIGCTSSDSAMITVNPTPIADAGNDATICAGNSVHIGSLGDVGFNYRWEYFPPGSVLNASSEELWVKPTSTMSYLLRVINNYGCRDSDTVKVTVNNLPTAYTGPSKTICNGAVDTLGKAPNQGSQYFWYNADESFTSKSANPVVTPSQTTMYHLSEINAAGCYKLDSVLIKVIPGVNEINAGANSTICSGTSVNLGEPSISGYSYVWKSVPTGFSSSSSDPQIVPSNTAIYILTKTANKGCSKTDSVTITVNPTPVADAGMDTRMCEGSQVILGAAKVPGNQYSWASLPAGFYSSSSDPDVMPKDTTTYILRVANVYGCTDTDSVNVIVIPSPESDPGKAQTVCAGTDVSLGAPPVTAETYFWSSNPVGFDSTSSNPIAIPDTTTTYTVTTFGRTGCSKRASVTITVNPIPDSHWKTISRCNTVRFIPRDSNKSFSWFFGDGDSDKIDVDPVHKYNVFGKYPVRLMAINSYGCKSVYDSVLDLSCSNTILNLAFYPNPFHSSAILKYELHKSSKVNIELFDAVGRLDSVIEDATQDAGQYSIDIDGKKMSLANGIYFLIFRSDEGDRSLKVISL